MYTKSKQERPKHRKARNVETAIKEGNKMLKKQENRKENGKTSKQDRKRRG